MKTRSLSVCSLWIALGLTGGRATADHPPIPASRFVDEASLARVIERSSASLAIDSRQSDPFGQVQDPKVDGGTVIGCPPVPKVALEQMVRLIRISVIDPSASSFVIAGRTFKVSDPIAIHHGGRTRTIKAVAVRAGQIDFVEDRSGETASWRIPSLPKGVEPQTAAPRLPAGAIDPESEAVIILDVAPDARR